MRETNFYCDRCSKKIEEQGTYKVTVYNYNSTNLDVDFKCDMCKDCIEDLKMSVERNKKSNPWEQK